MKNNFVKLTLVAASFGLAGVAHAQTMSNPASDATTETRSEATYTGAASDVTAVDKTYSGRVGLRVGRSTYRDNDDAYNSAGLDLSMRAGIPLEVLRQSKIQGEIALVGTSLSAAEFDRTFTAHVGAGPIFDVYGFAIGGRALAGAVYDEENEWRQDNGGEFRAGFERDGVSVFAAVGRTQRLTRVGLDVGTTF